MAVERDQRPAEWKNFAGQGISRASALFEEVAPNTVSLARSTRTLLREARRPGRTVGTAMTSAMNPASNANKNILDQAMKDIGKGQYALDKAADELYADFDSQTSRLFSSDTFDEDTRTSDEKIVDSNRGIAQSVIQSSATQLKGLEAMTQSLIASNVKIAKANSNFLNKSLFYGIKTITTNQMLTNAKLDSINRGITSLVEFNNKNTLEYYSKSLDMINNMGKMFASVESNRSGSGKKGDLPSSFNIKSYTDQVVKGLQESLFGTGVKAVAGNGAALVGGAGGNFITSLILGAISNKVKGPIKNMDKNLMSYFRNSMDGLASTDLVRMLGLEDALKTSQSRSKIKMSSYHKEALPWNGTAQKALVEVIPELLSSIDSKLDGSEKRSYDYESGKFKSKSQIQKDFEKEYFSAIDMRLTDSMEKLTKLVNRTELSGKGRDEFIDSIAKLMEDQVSGNKSRKKATYDMSTIMKNAGIDETLFQDFAFTVKNNIDDAIAEVNDMFKKIGSSQSVYRTLNNGTGSDIDEILKGRHSSKRSNLTTSDSRLSSLEEILSSVPTLHVSILRDKKFIRFLENQLARGASDADITALIMRENSYRSIKDNLQGSLGNTRVGKFAIGRMQSPVYKSGMSGGDSYLPQTYDGRLGDMDKNLRSKAYGASFGKSAYSTSESGARERVSENINEAVETADTPYGKLMRMSERDLERGKMRLSSTLKNATKLPKAKSVEDSIIDSNNMTKLSLASMITNFQGFTAKLFGKDGFFSRMWEEAKKKELLKKAKEKLFTNDDAIFKKQYDATMRFGKGVVSDVKGKVAGGYDYMYDNTMKYIYGEDYQNSEDWQGNAFVSATLNRKAKAEAEAKQPAMIAGGDMKKLKIPKGKLKLSSKPDSVQGSLKSTTAKINEMGEEITEQLEAVGEAAVGDLKESPTKKKAKFKDKFVEMMKKTTPKVLLGVGAGTAIGAMNTSFSLLGSMFLPGGPIAGAIAGAGLSILSQTDMFKDFMYGKMDPETQKRTGGIINDKLKEKFKKMAPFAIGGAALGALKGLGATALGMGGGLGVLGMQLLPGGILGGAILGSGFALLKNSDKFKEILFGKKDEDGNVTYNGISKTFKGIRDKYSALMPFLKKGIKGLGAGFITGMTLKNLGYLPAMLGMGGPIGLGIAGLGLGIASTSKRFNTFMFGSQMVDKDGNPIEGKRNKDGFLNRVMNLIKVNTIEPIGEAFKKNLVGLTDWTKEQIVFPFKLAFGPIVDSIKGVKDNVVNFVKDKFDVLTGGIMNLFKKVTRTLFSPLTKAIGFVGKSITGIASTAAKVAMSPLAIGLQGMQLLTAGKRAKEYGNFYKDYYKKGNISSSLQEMWALQEERDGKKTNIFQKMSDTVGAYIGQGEVADAARAGYNAELGARGMNSLGWRSTHGDKQKHYSEKAIRKAEERKWANIDSTRSKIINKDLYGREVQLNDSAVERYRKMFSKLGIDESKLSSSQDIMDLLYRRDDFKSRITKLNEAPPESPEQEEARKRTTAYQSKMEELLTGISKHFGIIGKEYADGKDAESIREAHEKQVKRLKRRFKQGKLKHTDLDAGVFQDYDLSAVDDDMLDDYRASKFSGTGDFLGYLKSTGIKTWSEMGTASSKIKTSEIASTTSSETSNKSDPNSIGNAFLRGELSPDEVEKLKQRLVINDFSRRFNLRRNSKRGDVASTTSSGTSDPLVDAINKQTQISQASLQIQSGGAIDNDDDIGDVTDKPKRFFDKLHHSSTDAADSIFSGLKRFRIVQKKEDEEAAEEAEREAEEKAEDEKARGLSATAKFVNGFNKSKDFFKKISSAVGEGITKFTDTKVGQFVVGGLKTLFGVGATLTALGTVVELIKPGLLSSIGNTITDDNAVENLTNSIEDMPNKINTKWEEIKTSAQDYYESTVPSWIRDEVDPWWEDTAKPAMMDVLITARDAIPTMITSTAEWTANNAETLVNAFTTSLNFLAGPLVEALVKATPDIFRAIGTAASTIFKTVGSELSSWFKKKLGIGETEHEQDDMTDSQVENAIAEGKHVTTETIGEGFATEEEAIAFAEEQGYTNAKVVYSRDGTYKVENRYLTGSATNVDEDGNEVYTTDSSNIASAANIIRQNPGKNTIAGKVVTGIPGYLMENSKKLAPRVVKKGMDAAGNAFNSAVNKLLQRAGTLTDDTVDAALSTKFFALLEKMAESTDELLKNYPKVKGLSDLPEGTIWKKIVEFIKLSLSNLKSVTNKYLLKLVNLASATVTKLVAKSGAAVLSGGAAVGVDAAIGAYFGVCDVAHLFEVREADADWGMITTSAALNAILFTLWGSILDFLAVAGELVFQINFKKDIATFIYKTISLDSDEAIKNLEIKRDALNNEVELYNAIHGTNLGTSEYADEMTSAGGKFANSWQSVTQTTNKDELLRVQMAMDNAGITLSEFAGMSASEQQKTLESLKGYKAPTSTTYTGSRYQMEVSGGAVTNYDSISTDQLGYGKNGATASGIHSQGDSRWGGMPIGRFANGEVATMSTAGCGPTALASVANTVMGYGPVTPGDMGKYAMANGYLTDGGANAGLFTEGAARLGLQSTRLDNSDQLSHTLASGKPAVLTGTSSGGSDPFTKAGHIVVADGISRNGMRILDPATGRHKTYSTNAVMRNVDNAWGYNVGYGRMPGMSDTDLTPTKSITATGGSSSTKSKTSYTSFTEAAANSSGIGTTGGPASRGLTSNGATGSMTIGTGNKILRLKKYIFYESACYKAGRTITPKGIMVHSTGVNNPNLKRYVGPDDGVLGHNSNGNHWNRASQKTAVHAFIGKLADGSVAVYQVLPWNWRAWHAGTGTSGTSANNTHISFEICEDGLHDSTYFNTVYTQAVKLCALLCQEYNLSPSTIITHSEGYKKGIASNHADVMHWFPMHGKNMDTFRADVTTTLAGGKIKTSGEAMGYAATSNDSVTGGSGTGTDSSGSGMDAETENSMMSAQYTNMNPETFAQVFSQATGFSKIKLLTYVPQALINSMLNGTSVDEEMLKLINGSAAGTSYANQGAATSSATSYTAPTSMTSTGQVGSQLEQMFNNPNNLQEELLAKTAYRIYDAESGFDYAAVNRDDVGRPSVGVYQGRDSYAADLLSYLGDHAEFSLSQRDIFKKYAAHSEAKGGALSTAQASELEGALGEPSTYGMVQFLSDKKGMRLFNNRYLRPISKWYDEGRLKDGRTMVMLSDIGNTGPGHITNSSNSFKSKWSPTSQSEELAAAKSVLLNNMFYGNSTGYTRRITNTYDSLKDYNMKYLTPSTGSYTNEFGAETNPLGFGEGDAPVYHNSHLYKNELPENAVQNLTSGIGKIGSHIAQWYTSKTGLSLSTSSSGTSNPTLSNLPGTPENDTHATLYTQTGPGNNNVGSDTIPILSGTDRDRFIMAARSQVGYLEKSNGDDLRSFGGNPGNNGFSKYGKEMGSNPNHWCAYFVSWLGKAAGIPSDVVYRNGGTGNMRDWYKTRGQFHEPRGEYQPQAGDVIMFQWSNGNRHVEMVTGSDSSKVYTIGGNTGRSIKNDLDPSGKYDKVADKQWSLSSSDILGYATPAWTGEVKSVNPADNLKLGYGTGPKRTFNSNSKLNSSINKQIRGGKRKHQSVQSNMMRRGSGALGYGYVDNSVIATTDTTSTDYRLDRIIALLSEWKTTSAKKSAQNINVNNVKSTTNNMMQSKAPQTNVQANTQQESMVARHVSLATRVNARK